MPRTLPHFFIAEQTGVESHYCLLWRERLTNKDHFLTAIAHFGVPLSQNGLLRGNILRP